MKQDKLFRILGEIDEELIVEAEMTKTEKVFYWKRYLSLAACAVLVIFIGISMNQPKSPENPSTQVGEQQDFDSALPLLAIEQSSGDESGFEGYMAADIDELVNENPWNDNGEEVNKLPVMDSPFKFQESKEVTPIADEEKMETLLKATSENLGVEAEKPKPGQYLVSAENQKYKIEVDSAMITTVYFQSDNQFPEEYNYTTHATYEETEQVAEYLLMQYKDYLDMENPKINITDGSQDVYGRQTYEITFFDDTGDITRRILNYNFNYVTFVCDEDGILILSKKYSRDLTDVIGEYPIVKEEEAAELLINGNYITSVPGEFPGEEYIKKAELVYRNGVAEKTYIPYYRFYVELPEKKIQEGTVEGNHYGTYYIPAVDNRYIKDLPKN